MSVTLRSFTWMRNRTIADTAGTVASYLGRLSDRHGAASLRPLLARLLAAALLCVSAPSIAESHAPLPAGNLAEAQTNRSSAVELDQQELEAWLDARFGNGIESGQFTGAVVSVVSGGKTIIAKGYGKADIESGARADSRTTRVRIGSTTKTFTATIISQLMEEGLIESLDDPVNRYLRNYRIPNNDGKPITLRHLLTHRAGFEDRFYFIGSDRPITIPVPRDLFDTLRPPYARPVDDTIVYSNFGVAALGLVIEDLTGMPFDKAIERRIFAPLGMKDTILPASIAPPSGVAVPGFLGPDGKVTGPVPFAAINPAVAQTGAIVSTAEDMARYANAQLGHSQAITPSILARAHRRIAENDPAINGLGMAFFVDKWAGHTTVGHGGNWQGFHTWLTLLPDDDIGFFVTLIGEATPVSRWRDLVGKVLPSQASAPSTASLSASRISDEFLTHLFGPKRAAPSAISIEPEELSKLAGFYRADRRPYSTIEELSSIAYFGAGVSEVEARSDSIYLNGVGPWLPVGEGRFVLGAASNPMVVIRPHPRTGKMTVYPEIGIYSATRISAWQNPLYQALLLHGLLVMSAMGILASLVMRRNWRMLGPAIAGLGSVVMLGCLYLGLDAYESLVTDYYAGYKTRLLLFVSAGTVTALAGAASIAMAFRAASGSARAVLLIFGLCAVMIGAILAQYNGIFLAKL